MGQVASAVGILCLFLGGCQEQVYVCQSSANCVLKGVQGMCLAAGPASYCAFPDGTCQATRLRWHTSGPDLIENTCVLPGTGADGGPAGVISPCRSDVQCRELGVQGTCVPAGTLAYCAFPDGICPSGLRFYSASAGVPVPVADKCVVKPDGAADDMSGGDR